MSDGFARRLTKLIHYLGEFTDDAEIDSYIVNRGWLAEYGKRRYFEPEVGLLYWRTSDSTLRIYGETGWQAVGSGVGTSPWTRSGAGAIYPDVASDDVVIGGTATVGSERLRVVGDFRLEGSIVGTGGSVTGDWGVNNDLNVGNDLDVTGRADVGTDLDVVNDVGVGNDLTVAGQAIFGGAAPVGSEVLRAQGELLIDSNGQLVVADSATQPPLNVTERSAPPSSPAANDIYLDDGTNTASGDPGWRRYTGAVWEDIGAVAGGGTSPWTESPVGTIYPTTFATDDVIIGANTTIGAERLRVVGDTRIEGQLDLIGANDLNVAGGDFTVGGGPNVKVFNTGDTVIGASVMSGGGEKLRVVGKGRIEGNLEVTGYIDPTAVIFQEQASAPTAPPPATEGILWMDSADDHIKFTNSTTTFDLTTGGGAALNVEDEGAPLAGTYSTLNFVGGGVTATNAGGGQADITVGDPELLSGTSYSGGVISMANNPDDDTMAIGIASMAGNEMLRIYADPFESENVGIRVSFNDTDPLGGTFVGIEIQADNSTGFSGAFTGFQVSPPAAGVLGWATIGFRYQDMSGTGMAGNVAYAQDGPNDPNEFYGFTGFGGGANSSITTRMSTRPAGITSAYTNIQAYRNVDNTLVSPGQDWKGVDVALVQPFVAGTHYLRDMRAYNVTQPASSVPVTVQDAYGMFIDDWSGALNYTYTNQPFGIYQAGGSDRNWFNGRIGIGLGKQAPADDVDAAGSINVGVNYKVGGVAGLSGLYTFGGGGSGDIASMTFSGGILTAITTVP